VDDTLKNRTCLISLVSGTLVVTPPDFSGMMLLNNSSGESLMVADRILIEFLPGLGSLWMDVSIF
jgi:hypothetical protein